ncbi:MAG: hypothetical protein P8N23_08150 [Methylophilaceae bacterium]|nr:hypothetical protein [Methylophilaceae bacterium]MDG1454229.1 hypothetical protein [Methylophilaceae bacterium]
MSLNVLIIKNESAITDTLIPNPAEITLEQQGWKRMFYVNPKRLLR